MRGIERRYDLLLSCSASIASHCDVQLGAPLKMLDGAEVAKHSTKESCWIVIDSKVYDVTSFLYSHPGGAAILLRQGGAVC